jgi:hypothetical protein
MVSVAVNSLVGWLLLLFVNSPRNAGPFVPGKKKLLNHSKMW